MMDFSEENTAFFWRFSANCQVQNCEMDLLLPTPTPIWMTERDMDF